MEKESLERGLRLIVSFTDLASNPGFGDEFHNRLEEVAVESKMRVALVDKGEL